MYNCAASKNNLHCLCICSQVIRSIENWESHESVIKKWIKWARPNEEFSVPSHKMTQTILSTTTSIIPSINDETLDLAQTLTLHRATQKPNVRVLVHSKCEKSSTVPTPAPIQEMITIAMCSHNCTGTRNDTPQEPPHSSQLLRYPENLQNRRGDNAHTWNSNQDDLQEGLGADQLRLYPISPSTPATNPPDRNPKTHHHLTKS